MKIHVTWALSLSALLSIGFPIAAYATNGLQLIGYGAKTQGMGGAGLAFPQDATAAANNPAGMARLGTRLDLELTTLDADTEFRAGPSAFPADPVVFIPGGGFNYEFNEELSFGVSVYSYGLSVDYETPVGAATTETSSSQVNLIVAPTFAYNITPDHSIGVGLRLAYQVLEQEGFQPIVPTDPGSSDATGAGFTIGYLGNLTPNLTVGVSYMSSVEMSGHSDYDALISGGDSIDLPEQYGVGIAWQSSERMVVALDYLRVNWGDVSAFGDPLSPPPADSGLGWKNQDIYRIGLAYQVDDAWTARVGYSYSDQLIDSGSAALSYAAPAVLKNHVTFGATYAPDERNEFNFSVVRSFGTDLEGTGLSAGTSVETSIWALSLGYGLKF